MRISDWSSDVCSSDLNRFAQRRDRILRPSRFEQNLAFEFEEIGVLGVGFEQGGDLVQRLLRISALMPGIGARIMGRDALVAFRIEAQRPRRLGAIADELCLDAPEALFDRRIARLFPPRLYD